MKSSLAKKVVDSLNTAPPENMRWDGYGKYRKFDKPESDKIKPLEFWLNVYPAGPGAGRYDNKEEALRVTFWPNRLRVAHMLEVTDGGLDAWFVEWESGFMTGPFESFNVADRVRESSTTPNRRIVRMVEVSEFKSVEARTLYTRKPFECWVATHHDGLVLNQMFVTRDEIVDHWPNCKPVRMVEANEVYNKVHEVLNKLKDRLQHYQKLLKEGSDNHSKADADMIEGLEYAVTHCDLLIMNPDGE